MNDTVQQTASEGGSDDFCAILQPFAKGGTIKRLSGLAELTYLAGRGCDPEWAWRSDLDAALSELTWFKGARCQQVQEYLHGEFYRGCEASLVLTAVPPQSAKDLANVLAPLAARNLADGDAPAIDGATASLAGQIARTLPVSIPEAARSAVDAMFKAGYQGSMNVESLAIASARDGWRQRGGFKGRLREIEDEAYSANLTDAHEAVSNHAATLARMAEHSVEDSVEIALAASKRRGIEADPKLAICARKAALAAIEEIHQRESCLEDGPYPANAQPPQWWVEWCEGGIPESFDLDREPGLLGDLARWSVDYAFRPVPEFASLVALATLAPVYSRRFTTPTAAGLNLYVIGLAETGGGKEAVIGAPQALLGAAKLEFLIGAGDFTSDSAIELALRSRPNFLACIDEVSEFIGAAQHRNAAAHSRTLRKAMLELYSKSRADARWSGKQKVDADNADKAAAPIYAPHLSLLGCATVAGFFEALTEGNLTGGFVNRWIVVRGGKPGEVNADPKRLEVPAELRAALTATYADTSKGNLSGGAARDPYRQPQMQVVPWGEGGEDTWRAVLLTQVDAVDAGRGDIAGRAAENCLKVATIRALARDGLNARVGERDIHWAWELIRASIATVEKGARENMAGSDFEMLVKTMERHVVDAGPDGIAWSKLLEKRGVAKHTDAMLDGALKRLEARGIILKPAIGTGPKGGRPGLRILATQYVTG